MQSRNRVLIFDTTLRDGEQCPGASMTVAHKIEVARALEALRVDVIEAGFAAAAESERQAIHQISTIVTESTVCSLTRANRGDIDAAVESLAPARRKRIHNFISTSPLHMKFKLRMEPEEVLAAIEDSVTYARRFVDDVEWSCEDGTRSDPEFLKRCFDVAIRCGATTVNIADTVGYTMPEEFTALITMLRNSVAGMEKVRFSVHCHDDLGMAVANSLAAIKAGARQVECTINGLGERAGNASLEEIVMALRTRKDLLEVETNIDPVHLTTVSKLVAEASGFSVPPNKAVVGSNAFAHESGIHQHGIIRHRGTYEIIDPRDVGAQESVLVLGKHSGKHALKFRLEELGYSIGDNALEDLFWRFKKAAEQKKEIHDDELVALVEETETNDATRGAYELSRLELHHLGRQRYQLVTHVLVEGEAMSTATEATTPVDAFINGIHTLSPETRDTTIEWKASVTNSTDFRVRTWVRCLTSERKFLEESTAPDVLVAFANAYLRALSRRKAYLSDKRVKRDHPAVHE